MSREYQPGEREELIRLITVAHRAIRQLASGTDARQLYRDAAATAERTIPGPVGAGVAGVLAMAAEQRRISGMSGCLGEQNTTLALAVAVLAAGES